MEIISQFILSRFFQIMYSDLISIIIIVLFLAMFALPLCPIAWFIVSLVKYIKTPKAMRQKRLGMLVASSVTFGVITTLGCWLIFTFMQDISFM